MTLSYLYATTYPHFVECAHAILQSAYMQLIFTVQMCFCIEQIFQSPNCIFYQLDKVCSGIQNLGFPSSSLIYTKYITLLPDLPGWTCTLKSSVPAKKDWLNPLPSLTCQGWVWPVSTSRSSWNLWSTFCHFRLVRKMNRFVYKT